MMKELEAHAVLTRRFGSDPRMVFLGGGNTSFKTDTMLYIKPSGVTLAEIQPEQFVAMDRTALRQVFTAAVPDDCWARESMVKDLMMAAVRPAGSGRPSVEAPLHEIIPYRYVYHMHPALINGMTCARNGRAACAKMFPDALWVDMVDPGYKLSAVAAEKLRALKPVPKLIFLENHGVFAGADTLEEIETLYRRMMTAMEQAYCEAGIPMDLAILLADEATILETAPKLRTLLGNGTARAIVHAADYFTPAAAPLSPDHIVYAKSFPYTGEITAAGLESFRREKKYSPKVVAITGKAVFGVDASLKSAGEILLAARDAALVQQLTRAFGGPKYLGDREREFIENWEVESYRQKITAGGHEGGRRLANKVCVVTGAAQGFGLGIAEGLAAEGGIVVVADLNVAGAKQTAADLEKKFGKGRAFAVAVNVSDESSVAHMVLEITRRCGGLDVFVANAGVLRVGSVKNFSKEDWDFVTAVNYTGYFLCVKHAARVMACQNAAGPGPWTDIIQINSKSGLEGSNKNAAYAGGKFGTIGLTQSFAKELIEDRIKVNSICPGNYFDGPLWSDPERGLFVQYLRTGKVPGATTVAEVKKGYEEKVPMGRGCLPDDVVRAILYAVEQPYETGQAIPVTGGQVMLR